MDFAQAQASIVGSSTQQSASYTVPRNPSKSRPDLPQPRPVPPRQQSAPAIAAPPTPNRNGLLPPNIQSQSFPPHGKTNPSKPSRVLLIVAGIVCSAFLFGLFKVIKNSKFKDSPLVGSWTDRLGYNSITFNSDGSGSVVYLPTNTIRTTFSWQPAGSTVSMTQHYPNEGLQCSENFQTDGQNLHFWLPNVGDPYGYDGTNYFVRTR